MKYLLKSISGKLWAFVPIIIGMGLWALGFSSFPAFSQALPHFSLYSLHKPLVNTASRGELDDISGCLLYKAQWVGFEGAPAIKMLDVNIPVTKFKSVFGLSVVDDQIGVNSFQNIIANYAYRLQLEKNKFLNFGLSFNARLFKSDLAEINTFQNGDPQFMNNSPTMFAPNFVFGAYYFTPSMYVGLAVPNLLNNAMIGKTNSSYKVITDFSPGKNHFYLNGGWKKELGKNLIFEPSMLIKYISGSPIQIDINSHILYNRMIGVGLSYRTLNTVVGMFNYQLNNYINIGYAFNHNFSQLSDYGSSSHEIALFYSLRSGKGKFKIDVPRF